MGADLADETAASIEVTTTILEGSGRADFWVDQTEKITNQVKGLLKTAQIYVLASNGFGKSFKESFFLTVCFLT